MELELLKENDAKLLEISEDWNFRLDGDPSELVKEMAKVMFVQGGIGLAAPQCGVLKRIFIMGNPEELVACINPKVVELSEDREVSQEGCLSFPNLWLNVKRPGKVKVTYQTVTGEEVEAELDGLHARVFLHEFDHLMGITFDQRVANLSLQMAKDRRKKKLKKVRASF
jgi:peptide deformylase